VEDVPVVRVVVGDAEIAAHGETGMEGEKESQVMISLFALKC
jgi:hypothetical protein